MDKPFHRLNNHKTYHGLGERLVLDLDAADIQDVRG
jgi:hypothetical protein